jgi:hypothetical protein
VGKWRSGWIGIGLMICINGCADPAPLISSAPAVAASAEEDDEIQNNLERQMVILFQGLLQMDRRENLALSRNQAIAMLPMVEVNTGNGELKQTDQLLIINLLSDGQKEFLDDFQERQKAKEQAMKEFKKRAPLSLEEREAMIHEFELKRRQKDEERMASGEERNSDDTNPGPPPAGSGFGNPKNVEQQLIELLESKIKKGSATEG